MIMPALPIPADVVAALRGSRRMLIATHENPDGDAVGSMVGLGLVLQELGTEVRCYCISPVPAYLDWLRLPFPLVRGLQELKDWKPDCFTLVDCADAQRAGEEMDRLLPAVKAGSLPDAPVSVCIDHHTHNPFFAHFNWVEDQPATGVLVALLAKELGCALRGDLAELIYLALVTDTGSFTYAGTNALTLELAAEIVRNGLSVGRFTSKTENNWPLSRMKLWGALMGETELACDGAVAVSVVTGEMLDRFGAQLSDLESFASWLRRLKGVRVVLLARGGRTNSRISLRSMGDVNVRNIAAIFGGGGHSGAAGISMSDPPREAADRVLREIARIL
jgi:phosphoesterase RecJ-like protein